MHTLFSPCFVVYLLAWRDHSKPNYFRAVWQRPIAAHLHFHWPREEKACRLYRTPPAYFKKWPHNTLSWFLRHQATFPPLFLSCCTCTELRVFNLLHRRNLLLGCFHLQLLPSGTMVLITSAVGKPSGDRWSSTAPDRQDSNGMSCSGHRCQGTLWTSHWREEKKKQPKNGCNVSRKKQEDWSSKSPLKALSDPSSVTWDFFGAPLMKYALKNQL